LSIYICCFITKILLNKLAAVH